MFVIGAHLMDWPEERMRSSALEGAWSLSFAGDLNMEVGTWSRVGLHMEWKEKRREARGRRHWWSGACGNIGSAGSPSPGRMYTSTDCWRQKNAQKPVENQLKIP